MAKQQLSLVQLVVKTQSEELRLQPSMGLKQPRPFLVLKNKQKPKPRPHQKKDSASHSCQWLIAGATVCHT